MGDATCIVRGSRLAVLAALAAALLAGCDHVPQNAIESCQAEVRVLPAKTDILLVIDDSGSMSEEQENLRQNLEAFVAALADSAVPHDFQIGITTTDVMEFDGRDHYGSEPPYDDYSWPVPYPKGALVAVNASALTDASDIGDFVYDPTGGFGGDRILRARDPAVAETFQANVLLGTHGAGKEQPFHAAQLALSDAMTQGANAGFLRPGARLGLVILTDEDDCSEPAPPFVATSNPLCHDGNVKARRLPPPAEFLTFLEGPIAGEQRDPVVAVIAGFAPDTLQPTGCATSYDRPTRLASLLDAMGPERSFRGSICDASFGPSLQRIAELLVPQTVPLEGAPPDPQMLVVSLRKADGTVIACPVVTGDEDSAQGGAVYTPPLAGQAATLTFQRACRLFPGDRVDLRIVCAG
jgi:hypothetical protein